MSRRGASFLRVLAARRGAHAGNAGRRRPRRIRVRPQRQPDAIRRTYGEALEKVTTAARETARRILYPHGPALVAEVSRLHGDTLAVTLDSPAGDASRIMAEVARDFFAEFTNERLASTVRHFGSEISDFQRREVARQFENSIGFDPFRMGEPWLEARIAGFTAENVALIKTVPQRYFADLETRLIRDLRAGVRWEEIAPGLESRYGVSEFNAQRIARDQVGKFYGELNKARQADVGVTHFMWRTAHDNRVRDEHVTLEGQRFSWEEGAPEEGIPGEPINCRCQGEPDLTSVLEALGENAVQVSVPEEVAPGEVETAPEPAAPPRPPGSMAELRDRMREIGRDLFGDDFTSTEIVLDADTGQNLGHRKWTGEIEFGKFLSNDLRWALDSIGTGRPLSYDEARSMSGLLHESIHGLGKWKAPAPDAATWTENMSFYASPIGRMIEEGTTEYRAATGWRAFSERLGMVVNEGPHIARESAAGVAYIDEMRGVMELARYATGEQAAAGELSAASEKVIEGLSSAWRPGEKVRHLADMIADAAPKMASENSADLRHDLIYDFLHAQAYQRPRDVGYYLDKILGARNSEQILEVRKWLGLP